MFCYLAGRASGKAGLDLRWPSAETVQFMYSRFETRPSATHDLELGRIPAPTVTE